jgi:hypothetical protein
MRRILYRLRVAALNERYLGVHVKCPIFLLYFNESWIIWIILFKSPIKNYPEISPMKAALIHEDRQTDKYEAKWRPCDCTKAHKYLILQT